MSLDTPDPETEDFSCGCKCHHGGAGVPCQECAARDLDEAYFKLKGAREKLCVAQMHVPAHWRSDLDQAIRIIDRCGSAVAPRQWSRFEQPEYPETEE